VRGSGPLRARSLLRRRGPGPALAAAAAAPPPSPAPPAAPLASELSPIRLRAALLRWI
jgi:hypothetical protein